MIISRSNFSVSVTISHVPPVCLFTTLHASELVVIIVPTLSNLNSSTMKPYMARAALRVPVRLIKVENMALVATSGVLRGIKCTLLQAILCSEHVLATSIRVLDLERLAAV